MDISVEQTDDLVRITIDGNIDTDGGHKLSVALHEVMDLENVSKVLFDMTTVKTTTSSGIGKLMNFYKFMDAKGGAMEINGISDSLYQQFMEIHLERIFPITK